MKAPLGLSLSVILATLAAPAMAEEAAIQVATNAQLEIAALTEQTLSETTTVTVQPRDAGSPEGALSESWPTHCLLSVTVSLAEGEAELAPGKLVCITEDRRILESQLDAVVEGFGRCQASDGNACARYRIESGDTGRLILQSPATLTPQPRNDQG
ncbi:hypothetical protein [Saccharospirillum salsuginis]|uniref:Uncharacterized protein n=1 Tax=Saccharospirillum salsuginis TaxID=418750 RepID=A0A918N6A8_9GAMM|nr:hypothetical protein [Saccharospirillum salsuginis]GGX38352.1 hypothetical protein GCM10007392_00640 [Saccharospirillum salsuginis]